jgi:hypothetical protein
MGDCHFNGRHTSSATGLDAGERAAGKDNTNRPKNAGYKP